MRNLPRRSLRAAVVVLLAALLMAAPMGVSAAPLPAAASRCTVSGTLRLGSTGPDVVCLETLLRAIGYKSVVGPNQYFGSSTASAVRLYQRAQGLVVDGIVGPITAAALGIGATTATSASAGAGAVPPKMIETRVIGTSVQGRPITAYRMGTPGGRVVMIVGVIHGDETKGSLITQLLRTMPTPAGIDLWLIDTMNPDGQANGTRTNANGVDLNRNFGVGWSYIPRSTTNQQYSGEAPADQPETQAMEAFIRDVRPAIGIWYHQDANVITVNGARREIPQAYGTLVGLGTGNVPCSQKCTGTAGTFANRTIPASTNFLVELPGSSQVTSAMIRRHAAAVLTVAVL